MARTGTGTGTFATNISTPLPSAQDSTAWSLPLPGYLSPSFLAPCLSSTGLSSTCGTEKEMLDHRAKVVLDRREKVVLDHRQALTARQEALTQRAGTTL